MKKQFDDVWKDFNQLNIERDDLIEQRTNLALVSYQVKIVLKVVNRFQL